MTLDEFYKEWNNSSGKVLVHTSGSTGKPKPIWAEKRRMLNSARITCDFLGLKKGDTALLCMSLDYIAGKMMAVRSIERGMRLTVTEPCGHPLAKLLNHKGEYPEDNFDLIAMVPMQVYNTLQVKEEAELLRRTRHLIIGGGAIDEEMEKELRSFPNAVWSTYGMTETLSHIALRRLNGMERDQWYTPFATVDVSLNGEGCLVIDAPQVCGQQLVTNDIAEIAPDGRRFRIIGRKDNIICSGGIKIQAEEAERLLSPYLDAPYAISKKKDCKFGEIAVLVIQSPDTAKAQAVCRNVLPEFWQPREYISVGHIPMTGTGKPRRAEIQEMIRTYSKQ